MAGPIAFLVPKFESKYEAIPESGCWLWSGVLDKDGYGHFHTYAQGKRRFTCAHRVAYEIYVAPIPSGMSVLHRCDVRSCVNPAHLFIGTQKDNIADMIRKGRDTNLQAMRNRTHCSKGHPFDEVNTRLDGNKRHCKECDRANAKKHYYDDLERHRAVAREYQRRKRGRTDSLFGA